MTARAPAERRAPRTAARSGERRAREAAGGAGAHALSRAAMWLIPLLFLAGLSLRAPAFYGRHGEGDENLYHRLVEQLGAGAGYNLQGIELSESRYPGEQFAQKLFYHPPGGLGFFWLCVRLFGYPGFAIAQVLAYAMFFLAMLRLGRIALPSFGPIARLTTAALAAFTPVVAHVGARHWLDGPLVAAVAWASGTAIEGWRSGRAGLSARAGLELGFASLIKTTAFVAAPGLVLLAWAAGARAGRRTAGLVLLTLAIASLVQLPWELWQWAVLGSPFPYWAGKPVAQLVSGNPYIWYLTEFRKPWIYFQLFPVVVWSFLPALATVALAPAARGAKRVPLALVGGVLVIVLAHVALGAMGYSKLMRYVILATPASVLLAAWAAARIAGEDSGPPIAPPFRRTVLAALLIAGLAHEGAQGVVSSVVERFDLIKPVYFGLPIAMPPGTRAPSVRP